MYDPHVVYCKDYSNEITIKGWSSEDIERFFRDGRRCSPFAEQELKNTFHNIWKPEKEMKGIDLVINDCINADVKCFTKSGCKISKSIYQGGGRNTDATADLLTIPKRFLFIIPTAISFPFLEFVPVFFEIAQTFLVEKENGEYDGSIDIEKLMQYKQTLRHESMELDSWSKGLENIRRNK